MNPPDRNLNTAPLPQPLQYGPPFPTLLAGSSEATAPRWLAAIILILGYASGFIHYLSLVYFMSGEGRQFINDNAPKGTDIAYWTFAGIGAVGIFVFFASPLVAWGLRYPVPAMQSTMRMLSGVALHFFTATLPLFIIHLVIANITAFYSLSHALAFFAGMIMFIVEIIPVLCFAVLLIPHVLRRLGVDGPRIFHRRRAAVPVRIAFEPPVDLLYSPRGPGLGSPPEQYPIIPAAVPVEPDTGEEDMHPHMRGGRWHCAHSPPASGAIAAAVALPTAARTRGSPQRYMASGSPIRRMGAHPYYPTTVDGPVLPTYKP